MIEQEHVEKIECPNCDEIQEAIVRLYTGDPCNTYVHDCIGCGYKIMESEWNIPWIRW